MGIKQISQPSLPARRRGRQQWLQKFPHFVWLTMVGMQRHQDIISLCQSVRRLSQHNGPQGHVLQ